MKKVELIMHDDDGWWLYYNPGWKSSNDPVAPTHLEHEDTKREVIALAKEAMKCDCDECQQLLAQKAQA